ncbi:DNA fragmentation factor subunit beta-like [Artemia franciscana]|uniref:CIDE-N domain-containing protein n=1 Tax=Artemia franciscana TaxID=6661 RepID=A0AA88I5W8_ARTSF|nr:hypothetical protein QYM36_004632 [Artemia franciscana]
MIKKLIKVKQLETGIMSGIAAENLVEVKEKLLKLVYKKKQNLNIYLEDFTELVDEDYFQQLDNNLIVLACEEDKDPRVLVSDHVVNQLSRAIEKNMNNINAILSKPEIVQKIKNLSEKLTKSPKCGFSGKEEHPEWFDGCPTVARTKEEFMFKRCQDRIRGYLRSFVMQLKEHSEIACMDYFVVLFKERLKCNMYHGHFFDRSAVDRERYCDESGDFPCQGEEYVPNLNQKSCCYTHIINPYDSKESRVLFSTWNLDHIVERSRTVVPSLIEAWKNRNGRLVNWSYFYDLMFTTKNLRLVHPVCHNKKAHKEHLCDEKYIYV